MTTYLTRVTLATTLMLAAYSAAAAPVAELKPDQLAAFVARNPLVVVQLTSPDPKCRYCVGADATFDKAAAAATNPAMKFARVQWPVWHKAPSLEPLLGASGIPRQIVYRDGKEMRSAGGRPESAADLLSDIDTILGMPPAPGVFYDATVKAAAAATPPPPMTAKQQDATRLLIRKDFFTNVTQACGKLFPDQASQYQRALDAWQSPRKDRLSEANMLMITRSSREDAAETSALVEVEHKVLQAWQVDKLGIPLTRKPERKDCDKIAASLDSAP